MFFTCSTPNELMINNITHPVTIKINVISEIENKNNLKKTRYCISPLPLH